MLRIIAAIGVIQVIAVLVSIIRSKLIAVLLGPAGVGVLSIVDQSVQLVLQLSGLSLPFAAVKFLSHSHSKGPEAFQKSYSSLLSLLIMLTTSGATISAGIVFLAPGWLGTELAAYAPLLILALFQVPAMALHGFFSNVLAAAQRARTSAVFLLLIAASLTLTAGAGIWLGGIQGYYWGNLIAQYAVVAGAVLYLKYRLNLRIVTDGHSIGQEMRENPHIVAFALILFTASFTQPVAYLMARHAILTHFGEAEAGLLQAAIALAASLNMVLNPANGLYLTPILNREIPKEEKLRAALEFQRKLMIAIGLCGMPLVLFAHWAVIVLFSPAFIPATQVVFLFVMAQCFTQLAGVYQALIIGLDDLKLYALAVAAGQLLLGVVARLLAPNYGLFGVAVAFLVSGVAVCGLTLAQLSWRHGLVLPRPLMAVVAYCLLALGAAGLIFNPVEALSLPAIWGRVGFYALFAGGLLFFLSLHERQQLWRRISTVQASSGQWITRLHSKYRQVVKSVSDRASTSLIRRD